MELSEFLKEYVCARLCDFYLFTEVMMNQSSFEDAQQALVSRQAGQSVDELVANLSAVLTLDEAEHKGNLYRCFLMAGTTNWSANDNRFLLFETPHLSVLDYWTGGGTEAQIVVPALTPLPGGAGEAEAFKAARPNASVTELLQSVPRPVSQSRPAASIGLRFRDKYFTTMSPYVTLLTKGAEGVWREDVVGKNGTTGFRVRGFFKRSVPRWLLSVLYTHCRYCQLLDWLYPPMNSQTQKFVIL